MCKIRHVPTCAHYLRATPTFMLGIDWPLYAKDVKKNLTVNQGNALADAFTHFIDVNIER